MITGPSGAGKTTLGELLAKELGYSFIDIDDYIWRKDTEIPFTAMYPKNTSPAEYPFAMRAFCHGTVKKHKAIGYIAINRRFSINDSHKNIPMEFFENNGQKMLSVI